MSIDCNTKLYSDADTILKGEKMIERYLPTPIMHRYVKHDGVLHFGGLIADDSSLSMAGQTEQILHKFGTLLAAAGSDKSKVISATVYITHMSLKGEMNAA